MIGELYLNLKFHLMFGHFGKQHLAVQRIMKYRYTKKHVVENENQILQWVYIVILQWLPETWYPHLELQKIQMQIPYLIPYQNKHPLPY